MSSIVIAIFAFLVVIGVLVTVHEWGHCFVARCCGVKVLTFSIGFGQPLYQWHTKSGMRCVIGKIPLGGYVKMLDERVDTVAKAERHLAYNNQSIPKRLAIVLAGPVANFLLAIVCFSATMLIGFEGVIPTIGAVHDNSAAVAAGLKPQDEIVAVDGQPTKTWNDVAAQFIARAERIPGDAAATDRLQLRVEDRNARARNVYLPVSAVEDALAADDSGRNLLHKLGMLTRIEILPAVIGEVGQNSAAASIDLRPGDVILAVNDEPVTGWYELVEQIQPLANQQVSLTLSRQGEQSELQRNVTLDSRALADGREVGSLGVTLAKTTWPDDAIRLIRYDLFTSLTLAVERTHDLSRLTLSMIWQMVTGARDTSGLGGPIAIAKGAGQSAQGGLEYYLAFMGLISISLGVINLLPIPMLDGGHVVFLLLEAICGRPLSDEIHLVGVKVGIIILVLVMGIALFNDFSSIISAG